MNCWQILGIEETFDSKAIKTAYAAKAKEYHPEEHPEEFQNLQQAYRSALRFAKLSRESPKQETPMPLQPVETLAEGGNTQNREAPPPSFEYDVVWKRPQDFEYDAVGDGESLKDHFFKVFFCITKNAYLINNLLCWEYILNRSPYDRLLTQKDFRYDFVQTVCHGVSGWQRETILFFEGWLQSQEAYDAEHIKETDLLCWKFKKIQFWGKIISTLRRATDKQKMRHEFLLKQIKRCGRDTSLTSREDVECYLSLYLPYAGEKRFNGKCVYDIQRARRLGAIGVLVVLLLFIGVLFLVQELFYW